MADIERIERRKGRTARAWPGSLTAELLDQLADAVLVADTEGRYVEANLAAATLLGYSRAELLSMGVADVTVGPPGWSQSEYVRFSKSSAPMDPCTGSAGREPSWASSTTRSWPRTSFGWLQETRWCCTRTA